MKNDIYNPTLPVSFSQVIVALVADTAETPEWHTDFKETCKKCGLDDDDLLAVITGSRELDVLEMTLLTNTIEWGWGQMSNQIAHTINRSQGKLKISSDPESYSIEGYYLTRRVLESLNLFNLPGSSSFQAV